MSVSPAAADAAGALAQLDAALDTLASLEVTFCADTEVVDIWRQLESRRRRLAPIDHLLIREITERHLPHTYGAKTPVALARQVLRVSSGEAAARVRAAEAVGRPRALSGELLPSRFPAVAAAQATGEISADHARVIVTTVDDLPDEVAVDHDRELEATLVDLAHTLDVDRLAKEARRAAYLLDQDGALRDLEYRRNKRDLAITPRPDGSSRIHGDLTAEATEAVLTVLDNLAAPKPEVDGVKDPRSAGQRRHDGLLDALLMVLRCDLLPTTAGVSTTIIVTATDTALDTGIGIATTGHGAIIPAAEAQRWARRDSRFFGVRLGRFRAVDAVTPIARLFTESQRLALIARDQGCTFPGCTAGPAWCEAHHVVPHGSGGKAVVGNGVLLCGPHHREFDRLGFTCEIVDGAVYWTAPAWLDPGRTRRRNDRAGV